MNITLRKEPPLAIGGRPKADLLPPEVTQRAKAKLARRNLIAVGVLAVLVIGGGIVGANYLASESAAELDVAKAHTAELVAEQGTYMEVRQVSSMLDTTVAARQVGTLTEIEWKAYTEAIQKSLPAGTTVTNFSAETATPINAYSLATVPLQGERIGQLTFTASSSSLPSVETWLNALTTLPGFVDAAPGSVVLDESTSTYTVSITMHINEEAYANRFAPEVEDAEAVGEAAAEPAQTTKDEEGK